MDFRAQNICKNALGQRTNFQQPLPCVLQNQLRPIRYPNNASVVRALHKVNLTITIFTDGFGWHSFPLIREAFMCPFTAVPYMSIKTSPLLCPLPPCTWLRSNFKAAVIIPFVPLPSAVWRLLPNEKTRKLQTNNFILLCGSILMRACCRMRYRLRF